MSPLSDLYSTPHLQCSSSLVPAESVIPRPAQRCDHGVHIGTLRQRAMPPVESSCHLGAGQPHDQILGVDHRFAGVFQPAVDHGQDRFGALVVKGGNLNVLAVATPGDPGIDRQSITGAVNCFHWHLAIPHLGLINLVDCIMQLPPACKNPRQGGYDFTIATVLLPRSFIEYVDEFLGDVVRFHQIMVAGDLFVRPPRYVWAMRIYKVGGKLWTSYRSAATSAAQRRWHGAQEIHFLDVADHQWKPIDKKDELRRGRLQNLAAIVTWDDPKVAVDLLATMMHEARQRLQTSKAGLSESERAEVDKLLGQLDGR